MTGPIRIVSLNVSAPGERRVPALLRWLADQDAAVLVLSEIRNGPGHRALCAGLRDLGFDLHDARRATGERGVLVATSVPTLPADDPYADLSGRAVRVRLDVARGPIDVVAIYGPSSPPQGIPPDRKALQRKESWLSECMAQLERSWPAPDAAGSLLIGDLNVIPPDHQPLYPSTKLFEYEFFYRLTTELHMTDLTSAIPSADYTYTWVSHQGHGYRFDHALCDDLLAGRVVECAFDHEPRRTGITDHSAIRVVLG
ncbi:endonuclease/exonuclease/phosphatase family protein [Branchiibius sp. NY16-3462-2]|uniref:endonuclease/exonuclease/phosphatase family protein n=1 Tax=Branchiibius sp. NY16-3462-2 TaxID=1807500 RepID=UPI000797C785|nr:endonuclease/exonuclease/phosphatase family protein [Branchiibius sp. NY16-3462-2]KYH44213.1 hypothetical protein AZH51_06585 [Branchiibius sp. NY16-3462-2]